MHSSTHHSALTHLTPHHLLHYAHAVLRHALHHRPALLGHSLHHLARWHAAGRRTGGRGGSEGLAGRGLAPRRRRLRGLRRLRLGRRAAGMVLLVLLRALRNGVVGQSEDGRSSYEHEVRSHGALHLCRGGPQLNFA
jgi:hypothetical protein